MDPRILTEADPELFGMFDSVDDWLDQEDCDCEGTCTCEEEEPDG